MLLLYKWFWRLREDHLWVRVVKEKYGVEAGGIYPKRCKIPFRCSI